jgi:hypothetical protein
LYIESHPNWKKTWVEKEEEESQKLAAAIDAKLRAAFGTFANILSLAQVREHVKGEADERAWLEKTLESYDSMMGDLENPASRSAFAEAMATACVSDMCSFVDKASSKAKLAAAHAAARPVVAKSQAKEAVPTEAVQAAA